MNTETREILTQRRKARQAVEVADGEIDAACQKVDMSFDQLTELVHEGATETEELRVSAIQLATLINRLNGRA